jgi:hypothetical protein
MSSIFGQVIDGAQVDEAVESFLRRWLPVYLAQMAEDRGLPRDAFPAPKTWATSTEFTIEKVTQLPAILILNAGLSEPPIREGDGSYRAKWMIGIAVVVTAGGDDPLRSVNRLAKRYGAAIRLLLIHHPSLEDPNVEGTTWEDENYDDIPADQDRSMASARLVFEVEYRAVANSYDGPVLPSDPPPDPTTPYPDWPTIDDLDHVHIDVTRSA